MTLMMETDTSLNCLDPKQAFNSTESLSRCFHKHQTSTKSSDFCTKQPYVKDGKIHDGNGTVIGWNVLDYWFSDVTVRSNSSFGAVIGDCIDQYCLNPDPALGGCGTSDERAKGVPGDILNQLGWQSLSTTSGFLSSGCVSLDISLNADFSGPGVRNPHLLYVVILNPWLTII